MICRCTNNPVLRTLTSCSPPRGFRQVRWGALCLFCIYIVAYVRSRRAEKAFYLEFFLRGVCV